MIKSKHLKWFKKIKVPTFQMPLDGWMDGWINASLDAYGPNPQLPTHNSQFSPKFIEFP